MNPDRQPIVSIIMATFNRAGLIGSAIQSILNQTMSEWELIVADDGSTDSTAAVLRKWTSLDSRIRYIPLAHVGRISIVSNAALEVARGKYIAILDDDDAWIDPHKLEKQVRYLDQHPEFVACAGGYRIINEKDVHVEDVFKPESDDAIRNVALRANPIANSTAMFRRSVGEMYDPNLSQFADWDFWLRIGKHGKLYNFPELFLAYRIWNRGSSFVNQRANALSAIKVVRRYRNNYPGYAQAALTARAYLLYTYLPVSIRQHLNSYLSRLKKRAFGKRPREAGTVPQ
ncbi:MAG TPA: glycosyltransferase family 2 protein [Terracidiphilus sp.]|nr:glycosyltransferase family 2 protein [Terracidiphilus sp.]